MTSKAGSLRIDAALLAQRSCALCRGLCRKGLGSRSERSRESSQAQHSVLSIEFLWRSYQTNPSIMKRATAYGQARFSNADELTFPSFFGVRTSLSFGN